MVSLDTLLLAVLEIFYEGRFLGVSCTHYDVFSLRISVILVMSIAVFNLSYKLENSVY